MAVMSWGSRCIMGSSSTRTRLRLTCFENYEFSRHSGKMSARAPTRSRHFFRNIPASKWRQFKIPGICFHFAGHNLEDNSERDSSFTYLFKQNNYLCNNSKFFARSRASEIPFAQTDYYKNSFPRTIRGWNVLPAEAVEASSLKAFRNLAFINRF